MAAAAPPIAYTNAAGSNVDLYLINPNGSGKVLLYSSPNKSNIGIVDMDPASNRLVITESASKGFKIITYNAAGVRQSVTAVNPDNCFVQGIDFHPTDGSLIVSRYCQATNVIEVRRWTEQDYQHAASVITAAYRAHVDSEINDQYRTLSGSLRFLNNIIRFPGCGTFDPESSFVAVHKRTHTLVGVILCSRVRYDTGHVTQVCVIPDYRGFGIGKALLAASVRNLTQRKFAALSLTVTEANSPAVELYKRLGFDSKRVFDAFVWEG